MAYSVRLAQIQAKIQADQARARAAASPEFFSSQRINDRGSFQRLLRTGNSLPDGSPDTVFLKWFTVHT